MARKMTLAKIIQKEENRISSDSQIAGTKLSFAEQLQQASKLLKPATKAKLSQISASRPSMDNGEESKSSKTISRQPSNVASGQENAKATVLALTAKINMAL